MRFPIALGVLVLAGVPAVAQDTRPDTEDGRYILRQVDDGFLRVDRDSGATSLCRERGAAWACTAVADDRDVYEEEIARLTAENADLARRVDELERDAGEREPGDGAPPRADGERDFTLELPSSEELDQVMQTFEQMMRRFLGMVHSLRRDLEDNPT